MPKISDLGRQLWLELKLGNHPLLQEKVITPILRNKDSIRAFTDPYFSIFTYQGHNEAGPLKLTYIGYPAALRPIRSNFFDENDSRTLLGKVHIREFHTVEPTADSDMLVIQADKPFLERIPWDRAIVQPAYVRMLLDISGTWDEVEAVARQSNSAKDRIRLARKYDYSYQILSTDADFDMFWKDMYLPTTVNRHGEYASPMSRDEGYKHFKNGVLLVVFRDGQAVSANLCRPEGKTLLLMLKGLLNSDRQLMREGAFGAADYFNLQWANEQGFDYFNFLGCDPFLDDGIFQYKRKWGASVINFAGESKRTWIKILRKTPAVQYALEQHPPITITKDDRLNGLIITNDPDNVPSKKRKSWLKNYETPGLDNLHIRSLDYYLG